MVRPTARPGISGDLHRQSSQDERLGQHLDALRRIEILHVGIQQGRHGPFTQHIGEIVRMVPIVPAVQGPIIERRIVAEDVPHAGL